MMIIQMNMENKLVYVLGNGNTINDFKPDGNITIGSNDIWNTIKTDAVVCVDNKRAFTPSRLEIIERCSPAKFYSHLDEWQSHHAFHKIHLHPARNCFEFKNDFIPYSNNSSSVACFIAWKFYGATEIKMFGVDFNNHPNFDEKKIAGVIENFKLLNNLLKSVGCTIKPHHHSALFGKI